MPQGLGQALACTLFAQPLNGAVVSVFFGNHKTVYGLFVLVAVSHAAGLVICIPYCIQHKKNKYFQMFVRTEVVRWDTRSLKSMPFASPRSIRSLTALDLFSGAYISRMWPMTAAILSYRFGRTRGPKFSCIPGLTR